MLRVKRDILRRSTIGAIFTNRSIGASAALPGRNQAYGVDGAFSFYQNVAAGAYYARTDTEGLDGDNESYQGRVEWVPDRYGVRGEFLKVGEQLQSRDRLPAARPTSRRASLSLRFSPRPKSIAARAQVHLRGRRSTTS